LNERDQDKALRARPSDLNIALEKLNRNQTPLIAGSGQNSAQHRHVRPRLIHSAPQQVTGSAIHTSGNALALFIKMHKASRR
jgi:hypothetical protein